jgi:ABC-type bacteriocin/lantibiotic exporter with double-glycine peptidase domain
MPLLPVSHRRQRQQSDCLIACTAMILDYLQVPFPYDRLPRLLRAEAHGTVFSHLQYLESTGVSVVVGEGTMETLRRHLESGLPLIIAVETGELTSYWQEAVSHAVVVVGIDDDFVAVNDPAFEIAPQQIPVAEFELAWQEQDYRYAVIGLAQIDPN